MHSELIILMKLIVVFLMILFLVSRGKPIVVAMVTGMAVLVLLFQFPLAETATLLFRATFNRTTGKILLLMYLVTLLQQLMDRSQNIPRATQALFRMIRSERLILMLMPAIIGLLPSVAALYMAADVVDDVLRHSKTDQKTKAFVTSWYRHLPESFFPTYSNIILATQLVGISLAVFLRSMAISVVLLCLAGYLVYLRKIPFSAHSASKEKGRFRGDLMPFLFHLLPILWVIAGVMIFELPVVLVVVAAIVLQPILNRTKGTVAFECVKKSFQWKILLSTLSILMFKDLLAYSGAIEAIPQLVRQINLPDLFSYSVIMMTTTILGGSMVGVGSTIPLVEQISVPAFVFLMGMNFLGSQFSPTHICLPLTAQHFGVNFTDLLKRTIPVTLLFILFNSLYCWALHLIL